MPTAARQLVGRDDELGAIVGSSTPSSFPAQSSCRARPGSARRPCGWPASTPQPPAGTGSCPLDPRAPRPGSRSRGCPTSWHGAGHVVAELPPIQRRALEAALLLGEAESDADDRAVAAAFLAACDGWPVRVRSASRSTTSSGWTRRRLPRSATRSPAWTREPVAALLAVRGEVPDWLRRAVPEGRLRTVDVTGLSLGATHELLHARLDTTFPRPALIKLWETSSGNPFFALELATALQRRGGTLAPGEELPIPSSLDELLHARIDSLGPEALDVARAVAALAEPTVALLEAAVGARFDPGLAETLDARILELDGERVRFTHPLLGSAVAARQTPGAPPALHARLAESSRLPRNERATSRSPRRSRVATSPRSSKRPLERRRLAARRLPPPIWPSRPSAHARHGSGRRAPAPLRRRRHALPRRGQRTERRRCSNRRVAGAAPGNERATIMAHLAGVQASPQDAVALYREALSEAEGDAALEATIHLRLATLMRFREASAAWSTENSPSAPRRVVDAELRCRALAAYGLMHFNTGRGIPTARWKRRSRSNDRWPSGRSTTVRRGFTDGSCSGQRTSTARDLFHEAREYAIR